MAKLKDKNPVKKKPGRPKKTESDSKKEKKTPFVTSEKKREYMRRYKAKRKKLLEDAAAKKKSDQNPSDTNDINIGDFSEADKELAKDQTHLSITGQGIERVELGEGEGVVKIEDETWNLCKTKIEKLKEKFPAKTEREFIDPLVNTAIKFYVNSL